MKDLLQIPHADLIEITDLQGRVVNQTISMYDNLSTKKIIKNFIYTKDLLPFNKGNTVNYYKIIISKEEFDLLN